MIQARTAVVSLWDEELVSTSVLRFSSRKQIEERSAAQGLLVDEVYGDWNGGAFDEAASHEMIFFLRRAG
jgi:hypothetical protein